MDPDDLEPRKRAVEPKNPEPMSVAELQGYILELETEIYGATICMGVSRQSGWRVVSRDEVMIVAARH